MPGSSKLSVVVVVLVGRRTLARCLTALAPQADRAGVEIIVPYDDRFSELLDLQSEFAQVRFVRAGGRHTYAELRTLAIQQARGDIVALTEDHCTAAPDWCARIVEVHAGPHAAVGGAVETAPDTALNWALYLCDYSRYMNPLPEGPAQGLSDCNVSYKRAALDRIAPVWAREFHENLVHGALAADGESLWFSPRIMVDQQRSVTLGAVVRDRYSFGRLFGSGRVATLPATRRALYAGGCLLLPPLLVARVAGNVLRARRCVGPFVRALPAICLLASVWAWGEFMGYVTGRAQSNLTPEPRPGAADLAAASEAAR